MSLLYFFEGIRNPILDFFFSYITYFGEETAFLVIAIVVFWCFSKRTGYYLLCISMIGNAINGALKLLFRIPRPWVKDENFTIVESAREAAGGYSFPSGHTQSAVGLFGGIALSTKRTWLRVVCIIVPILVAISRMYLGVHTPLDVGVGFAISLALIFALRPLFTHNESNVSFALLLCFFCAVAYLLFVELFPFPADIDSANYTSGLKLAYTLLGVTAALPIAHFLDENYLKSDVRAAWWAQIIKCVIGLGLLLAVKELLRSPLESQLGDIYAARALRYFIMVIFAINVWPLTFRLFSKTNKAANPAATR